jgi:NitT/TauT family transport system substrate-binding protein
MSFPEVRAAALVFLAAACGMAAAADTVRYGAQVGAQYSLRQALEENAAKHNLKYEFREFRSGTDNILALEQRELDVNTATTQHLLRAVEENIPIVWVAGWGGGYNTLVQRAELNVPPGDYAALKKVALERKGSGRKLKVGVPTGSMQHLLLLTAFKDAGMNPDADVDIVNIPFPVHPRALEAGEVDMVAGLGLFGAMSVTSGKGKLFQHMYGGKWGKQEIGFFVHRNLIKEKPDLVQRIVASHAEAIARVADPQKRFEMEAKASKLPPPVLKMSETEFLHVDYRTNMSDIAQMAERMHAAGWTRRNLAGEVAKNIDLSFLEKATGRSRAELSKW